MKDIIIMVAVIAVVALPGSVLLALYYLSKITQHAREVRDVLLRIELAWRLDPPR